MKCNTCDFVLLPSPLNRFPDNAKWQLMQESECGFRLPPMYADEGRYQYDVEKGKVDLWDGGCDLGRAMPTDDPRHKLIAIAIGDRTDAPR